MRRFTVVIVALALFVVFTSRARAASLIDTGPGGTSDIGASSLFYSGSQFQYLAGQFNLANGAVVDQLQGWMGPFSFAGDMNVKIYADNAGLPGNQLYSKSYSLPSRFTAGWEPFSGFNAPLPAGTYWMAFEPTTTGGFNGNMPGGVPNPLPKTAFYGNDNPGYLTHDQALGMRVDGRTSDVMMGAAGRAHYREDIPINGNPNGISIQTGGNGNMNAVANAGNAAGRGAIVNGVLEAGALARGFTDAPGGINPHSGSGEGQGVSWRPYYNDTNQPKTFQVSAILEGGANNGFLGLDCQVDARITALDPDLLAQYVQTSGGDAATYFLDKHIDDGNYANFPAAAVIKDYKFYDHFQADDSGFQPRNSNLNSGTFTIDPGEGFILVFDVYTRAAGGSGGGGQGTLNYLNTLHAAPNLFTDINGQPVSGIVAGSIEAVPEPAGATLLGIGLMTLLSSRRRSRESCSSPGTPGEVG